MKIEDFKNFNFSILGTHSLFSGDVTIEGDCIINSQIKGTLRSSNQSKIVIERNAFIQGDIYCHDVEIFGKIIGTIKSSGTVIIRSNAHFSGAIHSEKLSIYPGAQVNSRIETQL